MYSFNMLVLEMVTSLVEICNCRICMEKPFKALVDPVRKSFLDMPELSQQRYWGKIYYMQYI